MVIVTIDQFGRVQFPEQVRQQLGLTDSSRLRLEIQDGKIVLAPLLEEPKIYYKGHVLVVESEPTADLDIVHYLREARITEQLGESSV